jgi:hypothetical protein
LMGAEAAPAWSRRRKEKQRTTPLGRDFANKELNSWSASTESFGRRSREGKIEVRDQKTTGEA